MHALVTGLLNFIIIEFFAQKKGLVNFQQFVNMINSFRWSKIASHFPGRTDNEIKNHWNTRIKKKLKLMGINPLTHQPYIDKTEDVVKTESAGDLCPNSQSDEEHATRASEEAAKDVNGEYEMMLRNLDIKNQEMVNPYSPFPVGSSGVQQWVESVDSMMLWDGINQMHMDQYFLFSGSRQWRGFLILGFVIIYFIN